MRRSMKGFRIMCSLESWSETRSAISNANFHILHAEKNGCKTSVQQHLRHYWKQRITRSKRIARAPELWAELTLINGWLVFSVALDVLGEPLVKLFVGIKQRWHDEVQQGPQLRDTQPSAHLPCSYAYRHTDNSPPPWCSESVFPWGAACFDTETAAGSSTERWNDRNDLRVQGAYCLLLPTNTFITINRFFFGAHMWLFQVCAVVTSRWPPTSWVAQIIVVGCSLTHLTMMWVLTPILTH